MLDRLRRLRDQVLQAIDQNAAAASQLLKFADKRELAVSLPRPPPSQPRSARARSWRDRHDAQ